MLSIKDSCSIRDLHSLEGHTRCLVCYKCYLLAGGQSPASPSILNVPFQHR